jgi:hypothetical protein
MNFSNSEIIGNSSNVVDVLLNINTVTNGLFGGLMFMMFFFIVYSVAITRTGNVVDSAVWASFTTVIVGSIFMALGLLSMMYLIIPVVLFILVLGYSHFKN